MISILSGCFTTFSQAWNNGGPIAISIGWPIVSTFILLIGLSLAELASAYPTSGGIYWWAAKLGGPKAGFYAGWLNMIGLLAVTASVVYGSATFLNIMLGTFSENYRAGFLQGIAIRQQFFWFVIIMAAVTIINCLRSEIQALISNISVWWHVTGSVAIIAILAFVPDHHQDSSWVFGGMINNSGFEGEGVYWFYVLPLGFLLTQYTITGYDASAHLAEESHGAHLTAANGLWKSIFYSAIGGYLLLLALLFAATKPEVISSFDTAINPYGTGSAISILWTSLSPTFFKIVLVISGAGQLLCATASLTSCSRMMYAFSRDGLVPGSSLWSRVNASGVPIPAVLLSAIVGILITLPALWESPRGIPSAFYAVVSIGVIGLYLAFIIPIWQRRKLGSTFQTGKWNLGGHYRWINILAIAEIAVVSVYFLLPFEPDGVPGGESFNWLAVNYAPILVGVTLTLLWIWWQLSVKNWYKGPRKTA